MWNRKQLKSNAKALMKRSYLMMFLASLMIMVLSGDFYTTFIETNFSVNVPYQDITIQLPFYVDWLSPDKFTWIVNNFLKVTFITSIISIIYTIFVANPLRIGKARFFILNREQEPSLKELFSIFDGQYLNIVKIAFITDVKIILWSLLLIIPGIVKSYEYSMIPYILAENPSLSTKEVFQRTYELTSNRKMDLFILDLSFFGWLFLCGLTMGIGLVFLQPYMDATQAEAYAFLKKDKDGNEEKIPGETILDKMSHIPGAE